MNTSQAEWFSMRESKLLSAWCEYEQIAHRIYKSGWNHYEYDGGNASNAVSKSYNDARKSASDALN